MLFFKKFQNRKYLVLETEPELVFKFGERTYPFTRTYSVGDALYSPVGCSVICKGTNKYVIKKKRTPVGTDVLFFY